MQKALIIDDTMSLNRLNNLLEDDWKVVQTCPMPSSKGGETVTAERPTCLVIIQK